VPREKDESATHILCDCEAIAYLRFRHLGHYFMEPCDYQDAPVSRILHVIWSVGLLEGWNRGGCTIDLERSRYKGRSRAYPLCIHSFKGYGKSVCFIFLYNVCLRQFSPPDKYSASFGHTGLRVKRLLFLSDANQNWNVLSYFNKTPTDRILRKSVQQLSSCYRRTGRRTERHDEPNARVFFFIPSRTRQKEKT
jgi:hypothetical protein